MMRVEHIGDATLYLGDCRPIIPTLGRLESVVSDPPYGMAFQSNYRTVVHKPIAQDEYDEAIQWTCKLNPTHSLYCFGRWDNLARIPRPKSVVVWVKNNWSMGDLEHEHARQTEIIFFYPGAAHDFPSGRPSDILNAARTGNGLHPTEKPVDLMTKLIAHTRGVVCDPFMGSGTTGVAAVKMRRKFIGIEVEESYFDIACRRIEEAQRQGDIFLDAAN